MIAGLCFILKTPYDSNQRRSPSPLALSGASNLQSFTEVGNENVYDLRLHLISQPYNGMNGPLALASPTVLTSLKPM